MVTSAAGPSAHRDAVREIDIADLLTLYGITDEGGTGAVAVPASLANQRGWWHRYRDVLPSWFQAYIGLEGSAQSIRSYDAQFLPGLLQTSGPRWNRTCWPWSGSARPGTPAIRGGRTRTEPG